MKINPKALLYIYAAIPFVVFAVALDVFLFGGQLRKILPLDPDSYLFFVVLFTLPHIIASFFSFADKEYLSYYKSKLVPGVQLVILAAILIPLISLKLALYTYAIFTMIHVFFQQSGVAKSLMRGSSRVHTWWQWSGAIISTIIYFSIFDQFNFVFQESVYYLPSLVTLIIVYTLVGLKAVQVSKTTVGKIYFWGTHFLPVLGMLFVSLGYPIFAIALPRVVHDLTGYAFYITHDYNRSAQTRTNWIYRMTSKLRVPSYVVTPALSVAVAFPFQSTGLYKSSILLLMVISLMHYYIESFVWKSGTLHRDHIAYSA